MTTDSGMTLQQEIWQWVAAVPSGQVASYGQIAALTGHPGHARYVGAVLKKLPQGSALPWHRILRSNGTLAFPPGSSGWQTQKGRLEAEGILLINHRVRFSQYQWRP